MSEQYFPNQTEEQRLRLIELVDNTALGNVFSVSPDGMDYDELKSLLDEEDGSLWELEDFVPWEPFQDYPLVSLSNELGNYWESIYNTIERALDITK